MNLEYDFDEIKEYSSVYDRNPTFIIPFFIGTIIVFIIVFLVMIFTLDKEYVVTAQGSIQSEDTIDITFPASGKVSKVNYKEGDPVKKDDVIFELDDSYYKSQIEQLNSDHEIDLTNEKLYLKEKDCINLGENDFKVNDKDEAPFYYRMEVYLQSINSLYSDRTNSNVETQKSVLKNNALSEASYDLENANNDMKIINDQIQSLGGQNSTIYNSSSQTSFNITNESSGSILQSLVDQKNLKQKQIDLINLRIKSINQNENLFDPNKNDEKSNYYKIEAYLNNVSGIQSQGNSGQSSTNTETQIEKLKNDMLIDINTNLKNISDKKADYDIKLSSLQNQASNLKIKSPKNGYIHYLNPVAEGMTIDASRPYVRINGVDTNSANMITMIPAAYIKNINTGCKAKVSFDLQGGYSKKYINGTISSIDSDVTSDGVLGRSYYKAYLKLDENIENPRVNMPAEVKLIYDKKKWVDYILEMLSFKSKTIK